MWFKERWVLSGSNLTARDVLIRTTVMYLPWCLSRRDSLPAAHFEWTNCSVSSGVNKTWGFLVPSNSPATWSWLQSLCHWQCERSNASTAAATPRAHAASVHCETQPCAGTDLWLTPGSCSWRKLRNVRGWHLRAGDLPKWIFWSCLLWELCFQSWTETFAGVKPDGFYLRLVQ